MACSIGATRVGYKDGNYLLNPTTTQLKTESDLDLVVAGTQDAVLMVESEASGLSEDVMLGAVLFGMYADRAGRRASLTLSVAMMCAGSLLIAVILTLWSFVIYIHRYRGLFSNTPSR